MRIRVVSPIVDPEMAEAVRGDYAGMARPTTEISVATLEGRIGSRRPDPRDPVVIAEVARRVQEAEAEGMDAVVIDCMVDPGLEEGRRLVSLPVIGPAQTSFHLADVLGYRFSVVALLQDAALIEERVSRCGLSSRAASVRHIDVPFAKIARDRSAALKPLVEESRRAVDEDGAQIIIPGCTGMLGLAGRARDRLADLGCRVPIIEPALLALRLAEALQERA